MVRLGDTDVRIGPLTELAAEHEREDAGEVGLIGDEQQVEQELHMFFEGLRHTDGSVWHVRDRCCLPFRPLDTSFDLADVIEVLVEPRPIA